MAAIAVILDKRRENAEGNYPVKIRITNNQDNTCISLNVFLPAKSWIKNGVERPVKTSYPGAKVINDQIQSLFIEFRKKISDLELSGFCKNAKAPEIKKRLLDYKAIIQPSEKLFKFNK